MKFLALEQPNPSADWSNETQTLKAEALQVLRLYLDDCLREIYFNENHEAVLILECESLEKAKGALDSLPLVQKGLIGFRVMRLMPYTGIERVL